LKADKKERREKSFWLITSKSCRVFFFVFFLFLILFLRLYVIRSAVFHSNCLCRCCCVVAVPLCQLCASFVSPTVHFFILFSSSLCVVGWTIDRSTLNLWGRAYRWWCCSFSCCCRLPGLFTNSRSAFDKWKRW
jgi:hypothetical protein